MYNNKGQSLVLFIIVLPILLLILILVIDIGRVIVMNQELENISNIVLDYGLDNFEVDNLDSKIIDLIYLNNDEIDYVDVKMVDDKIYINLSEKVNGIFSKIIDISFFEVHSSFVGYIDGNYKVIERING